MYGLTGPRRGQSQSTQSDDSSYGSYHGPNASTPTSRNPTNTNQQQLPPPPPPLQNGGDYGTTQGSNRNTQERKLGSNQIVQQHSAGQTTLPLYNQKQQQQQQQQMQVSQLQGNVVKGPLQHQYNLQPHQQIRQN